MFSFLGCSDEIYIAPSGVQKERILPEDLFIQNIEGDDIQVPPEYKKYVHTHYSTYQHNFSLNHRCFISRLKKSQCTPLFMLPYRQRRAGAVIHTHSPNAVMATLLWPGKEFRCTYLEMIKVRKKNDFSLNRAVIEC